MIIITLQSSDGERFHVDMDIIKVSATIKTIIENLEMETDEIIIPLHFVTADVMRKIIEWVTYHKDDPPAEADDDEEPQSFDDICNWDLDFLNLDNETLFELILAAKYLRIDGLLNVTCKTVANMVKGKTPREVREELNLSDDD